MIEEILHVPYYHPSEGWFFGKPITEDEAESLCRQMGIPFRRPDPKDRAIAYLFSTPVAGTEYVECFDVIFLDPPYAEDFLENALNRITEIDILRSGGIIVTERPLGKELHQVFPGYSRSKDYKYGKTLLSIYTKDEALEE